MNGKEDPVAIEFRRRLGQLDRSRPVILASMVDIQLSFGALLQYEALRLEKKLGPKDPRARRTREALEAQRRRLDDLAEKRQLAQVAAPQAIEDGAAVYGRVVDLADSLGIPGLEVRLVDRQGRPMEGIGASATTSIGAYVIRAGRETASRAKKAAPFVGVFLPKGRLLHRHEDFLALIPGTVQRVDLSIDRGDVLGGVSPMPRSTRARDTAETEKPEPEIPAPALEDLPGIGPARSEKLRKAGIATVAALASADEEILGDLLRGVDTAELKKSAERLLGKK